MAKPISWVTITMVIPLWARDFMTSSTSLTISGSRADVGSSNSIMSGCIANALAMATLCFCPPDRRFGYSLAFSERPTFCKSPVPIFSASCLETPFTFIGAYVRFSSAVICGNRWKC
ncbi:hypothetical protein B14911_08375 [Bacillus sp. NRRL B-14911]|nr:hypothetical protein B14911_08375 [Bacillus sp. NRRL B-14911]